MKKKHLLTILQLTVTIVVLGFVFRKPEQRQQMADALRQADPGWLLAALAVTGLTFVCATLRWWLLVRAQNLGLSLWRTAQISFIGSFFNLFALGATGGDVIKVYYALREVPERKAGAFLTVLMDRLLGLLGLVSLAVVFSVFRYRWLSRNAVAAGLLNTVLVIMAAGLFGIASAAVVAAFNLAARLPARLPGRTKLLELSTALRAYGSRPGTLLAGFGLSVANHVALFAGAWCAARAIGARVSFLDVSAILPVLNTILSIPVSVSGVGMREALSRQLFSSLCGISEADAVVLMEIAFLCTVFYSLVGGVAFLFFRTRHGSPAASAPAEVARLEEEVAGLGETNGAALRPGVRD